jgi:uncharacterized OsmC-like protein
MFQILFMHPDKLLVSEMLWSNQPDKAKLHLVVEADSVGSEAVMTAGPFTWRADFPPPLGGNNKAPTPITQLIGALGACAVVLIRDTLAPQFGVAVESVKATTTCDLDARGVLGMDGVLPDLQNLKIDVQVKSPSSADRVKQLYLAWKERCPVYLAFIKSVNVEANLEVQN